MPTEVLVALIGAAGMVIAAIISVLAARRGSERPHALVEPEARRPRLAPAVLDRLADLDLAGIATAEDLLERARSAGVLLSRTETQAIVDHFPEVYEATCQHNTRSASRQAGMFSFGGEDFFFNGGTWVADADHRTLTYHGHALAWTRRKFNLLKSRVRLTATFRSGGLVSPEDPKPKSLGLIVGITLNALNWADPAADAVTLAVATEGAGIRHRVYHWEPEYLMWVFQSVVQPDEVYEVLVELSSQEFSLRIREAGTNKEFRPVLLRAITPADVRRFTIPLIGHLAIFSYGLEGAETSHLVTLTQLRIEEKPL
jgi:hypothetical protein